MPNRPAVVPQQLPLFVEVIETRTTRDRVTADAVWIEPPLGRGWRVADSHRERHTKWQRRKPVVLPRRWRRKC
jgi:hypothetical protein